jgi:hypothetical protein
MAKKKTTTLSGVKAKNNRIDAAAERKETKFRNLQKKLVKKNRRGQ